MAIDQQRLSPTERSNLVAYLDGELGEHESHAIATKLVQSVTARRELEVLEKTWALLDHLPRPKASEHLTERTLDRIQTVSQKEGQRVHSAFSLLKKGLGAIFVVGLCGAFFLFGVGIVQYAVPNPTARLTSELSIAEHLDEYQSVESFAFLKQLEGSQPFLRETDPTINASRE